MSVRVEQYSGEECKVPDPGDQKVAAGLGDPQSYLRELGSRAPAKLHSAAPLGIAVVPRRAAKPISLSKESPDVQTLTNMFIKNAEGAYLAAHPERAAAAAVIPGKVLEWLTCPDRANAGQKPRIEFRKVLQDGAVEYSNIALIFSDNADRERNAARFRDAAKELSIVSAGSTTLEIGLKGINKATVIHAIAQHLPKILPEYTAGPLIDARTHRSALCLDADGTLWEKPKKGESPKKNHLGNSPARDAALAYLRAGGVLAVISGNDPLRTVERFLMGIPVEERDELLPRVIISGAGGHTLMTYQAGRFQEFAEYRKHALQWVQEGQDNQADLIYLGDDVRVHGNDFPGFTKVGKDRAVCVGNKPSEDVQDFSVPGGTLAVKNIIELTLKRRMLLRGHLTLPLFTEHSRKYPQDNLELAMIQEQAPSYVSSVPSLRQASPAVPDAERITENALRALGLEGVQREIFYIDQVFNAPVSYDARTIEELREQQKNLLNGAPESSLNFDELTKLGKKISFCTLPKETGIRRRDLRRLVNNTLDSMRLKSDDVVRILLPGNNDQATPMYIAHLVALIKEYADRGGRNLNVQVLIMGQGGHATTATFHQFASVKGGNFEGVEEAQSLGGTLKAALLERGIDPNYDVKDFNAESGLAKTKVEIKLAKNSRHTGMNVQEADLVFLNDGDKKPGHILMVPSIPSSTRQTLTFAHQLKRGNYKTITSLPMPRTSRFIRGALNNRQAVTEMYAGLAERARYYLYAFQKNPYIPISQINPEDLTRLYQAYDKLSGTNDLECSKVVPMADVLKFFQSQFQLLERSIVWNRDPNLQDLSTRGSMQDMATRLKRRESFERAMVLYKNLTHTESSLSADQARTLRIFCELHGEFNKVGRSDREKVVYYVLMAGMLSKLSKIQEGLELVAV